MEKIYLKKWTGALLTTLLIVACENAQHVQEAPISNVSVPYACEATPDPAWVGVVGTDYQTGEFRLYDQRTAEFSPTRIPIHFDALVRTFANDKCFYVVNHLGADNIQIIDPTEGRTMGQYSVGRGTNPHDVYVRNGIAYVSRYEVASLVGVDLRTGLIRDEVDLFDHADPDGIPEMSRMFGQGHHLAVSLQRLDHANFAPTDFSKLLVINLETLTVEREYEYSKGYTNPYSDIKEVPTGGEYLYQALVGNMYVIGDGGLQRIDADTWEPLSIVMTEEDFKGQLLDFEMFDEKKGLGIVSRGFGAESVFVAFDLESKQVDDVLKESSYAYSGLRAIGSEIWLFDRVLSDSKIRRFDLAGKAEKGFFKTQSLPPFFAAGWK